MTNDEINERIDKMGKWAANTDEKLKSISALIAGLLAIDDTEQTQLIQDMGELKKRLVEGPSIKRAVELELIDLRQKVETAKETLDDFGANLFLNVCAEMDDDNKLIYTNESQRKEALKLAKKHSDEYQEALGILRELETDRARLTARITEVCESNKIDIRLYAGYVARLENMTARITLNGKEY